ncbi:MAG: nickel-dependent lactate racemase [Clostridiales bacterium]|nr:nickel-dependent lactate racemase [Candidatus Cacconaster stercorequi]
MGFYSFAYGDGSVSLPVDESCVIGQLHGNEIPPVGDIKEALYRTLNEPIDAQPLCRQVTPETTVALVISDMSRFWMRQDRVIPHIVDYLTEVCHLPLSHLTIVVANGTHEGGSEQDLRKLVTDAVYDKVSVVNHDCLAPDLVYLGTTTYGTPVRVNAIAAAADLCICLGAATYHVMAGFGGGRKSILPGISGMETIQRNHALSLDPQCLKPNPLIGNGKLEGNPLHLDMCQAAGMMKKLFMVNLVVNAQEELCAIFSGHYLHSWLRACREVERVYQVPVPEKADVIIAGCGGYPRDMSLYQGTKAIDNVESGLKEGGTLILIIEARDGGGPAEYFDWSRNWQDGTLEQRLREHFTVAGYVFFLNCYQASHQRIMLLSSIDPQLVQPMGIEAYSSVDELMAAANIDGKRTYIISNGGTVVPVVKEAQ